MYEPLRAELLEVVLPVLSKHPHALNLNIATQKALAFDLVDKLTSEFFPKGQEYLKKQQRQEEVEASRKNELLKRQLIEDIRNVSLAEYSSKVTSRLNDLVNERNPGSVFVFDEFCMKAFDLCLKYFHPGSQTIMNQAKGIAMLGKVGTGKSTLLTAFCDNPLSSFRIIKAQEIVEMYVNNPGQTFSRLLSEKPLTDNENEYGFSRYDLLIEEVGREQLSVNIKGESFKNTPVNVLERFFLELYDNPGIRVHIISNAETPEKLIDLYGEAAASRIYEMFNVISFDPKSPNRRFI